ncbi:MAG: LysR family transcriptional regulator, partial [Cyclobacteriaceae bacterium]
MTFSQLQYALALQKYSSFKAASAKLNITQPALSLQIGKLENELGLSLFDRSKNPVSPTPEGYEFLIRAKEIVSQVDDLKSFAQGVTEKVSGKLKVGIIPTLAPFLVPLFSDSLQRDHPGIALDISELITNEVIHGVLQGDLDAGIISTPVNARGIASFPLFYEK